MSRHHVEAKWSTDSPKFRKLIEPLLPLPCVNPPCKHGGMVERGQRWQVAHRAGSEQRHGQRATIRDVGPAHADCNQRDGGRTGAAIVNRQKRRQQQITKDIRAW